MNTLSMEILDSGVLGLSAMSSKARALVLDGVLDAADPVFAAQAWARIAAESAAGRQIVVVTYHFLNPPYPTPPRSPADAEHEV